MTWASHTASQPAKRHKFHLMRGSILGRRGEVKWKWKWKWEWVGGDQVGGGQAKQSKGRKDRNEKVASKKNGKKLNGRNDMVVGATLRSDLHCHRR